MATISVIVPAYNQGHYLEEAIGSVVAQSYEDWEIIVVDDGSTDNTRAVATSFSDDRVRYHYQSNQGLSAARNTGISLATGDYISFLDSDDLFLPQKLELLLTLLESQPELGFAAGEAIFIDGDGQRLNKYMKKGPPLDLSELLLGNPFHVGSVLVRKRWLDRVGTFDEVLRACEDWDLWLRLAKEGCRMDWVAQPVSLYRIHRQQMTRGAERMRTAMFMVLDKTFGYLDLPESWRAQRDRAYAAAYTRAAARFYHAGAWAEGQRDLVQAATLNPDLLENEAQRLATQLAGWADAPVAENPLAYLEKVYDTLPESLAILRSRRRRDLGRMAMQLAFRAYHKGDLGQTRRFAWQALCYQPTWVQNRGVLSIFLRSCLSFR
jgi:hypothetical protein